MLSTKHKTSVFSFRVFAVFLVMLLGTNLFIFVGAADPIIKNNQRSREDTLGNYWKIQKEETQEESSAFWQPYEIPS